MAQLVNSLCVLCQKRIGSIIEGRFCKSCTSPYHTKCRDAAISQGIPPGNCQECGCDPAQIKSVSELERRDRERLLAQEQRLRAEPLREETGTSTQSNYWHSEPVRDASPISRVCPACRQSRFKSVRPNRLVTFTWDRVCLDCGTRYTPPPPTWAGPVFLGAAIILGLLTLLPVLPLVLSPESPSPLSLIMSVVGAAFFSGLAIGSLIQGIRALRSRPNDEEGDDVRMDENRPTDAAPSPMNLSENEDQTKSQ